MNDSFSISQLAQEFGVTPRALRFYEDRGLLSPRREGQNRIYSADDRTRLAFIVRGKRLGMPLSELKRVLDRHGLEVKANGRAEARQALKDVAARIAVLELQREDLNVTLEALRAYAGDLDAMLTQPASAAQMESARAFEEEALRRLASSV